MLAICSADPAVGCDQVVIPGFQTRDMCETAAVGPIPEALRHVKPGDVRVTVTAECVAVELRES
jgi:hypothetical protein